MNTMGRVHFLGALLYGIVSAEKQRADVGREIFLSSRMKYTAPRARQASLAAKHIHRRQRIMYVSTRISCRVFSATGKLSGRVGSEVG